MRRSGTGSGGGIGMNKNVEPSVRTGSGSKGVSPGWVGQKGQMQGSHVTRYSDSDYRGEQKFTGQNFQPVPFGKKPPPEPEGLFGSGALSMLQSCGKSTVRHD